nr:hypothetical protein [Tanacetum cinerariifolium]
VLAFELALTLMLEFMTTHGFGFTLERRGGV